MKKQVLFLLAIALSSSVMFAQNNWINANANGAYGEEDNWDGGYVPDEFDQVLFDGNTNATDCLITDAQIGGWFEIGVGGVAYGSVIVKNGGNLESKMDHWTAVGWTTEASLVVEAGGIFTTASHLWLGFNAGSKSYVDVYGTINVNGMFGVNFEGLGDANSSAKFTVHNGGIANLTGLEPVNPDPTKPNSFKGTIADGSFVIMGGGTVNWPGDKSGTVQDFVTSGKIVAPGGSVSVAYDAVADKTTVTSTAAPLGVKDFASLAFEAYPNPTTGIINIKSKTPVSSVKLYNTLGQIVVEKSGISRIDISKLSAGYYVLKVQDDSGQIGVRKIIKK